MSRQPQPAGGAGPDSRDPQSERRRLLLDAGVGVGLILALALVFVIDRGFFSSGRPGPSYEKSEDDVDVDDDRAVARVEGRPLRLAVTPPEYDDMGKLLDTLGTGYQYTQVSLDDLLDAARLAEFDVVFLTCGGVPREWLDRRLRTSERDGVGVFRARPEIVEAVHESLRRFVGHGGTLYVSDLHFDLLATAFPEFVNRANVGRGAVQDLEVEVVDSALKRILGPTIPLRFEMPSWRPAAFHGPDVTTYIRGDYGLFDGQQSSGPLLVSFPYGEGTVVFTSFHNEAQNTEMELDLLRHLVFTTVTAREDERIMRTMIRGGFSPAERSLLSASTGSKPVRESYGCRRRGPLRFVLGFDDQGARLRLTVVSPEGDKIEKTGTKTFQIDVDDAAAGEWQYTITPLEIPYENFPYRLTIGEKRKGS